MERLRPLNQIPFDAEWLVTNGEVGADGDVHFPDEDPAEEVFNPPRAADTDTSSHAPHVPPFQP